jgi:4-amino-4-deoxy-L-arabinose transferase-like glycosyltransferase
VRPESGAGTGLDRRAGLAQLVLAAALRVPTLLLRRLVEGDGVHYAHLARSIRAGDLSGLANPYWSNLWPAMIAVTSLGTGLDVVTAARLLSLVSGVLLVLVTAVLATRVLGPTSGLAAGLLCAAHPWLIHFSTLVFTESFFALLLTALLLAGLRAGESAGAALRAGLLAGAALLTRPEAYAAIAVILAVLALPAVRPPRRAALSRAAVFASVVALCVLGRAMLVHRYHGRWDFGLGTKGSANLLVGLAQSDQERARVATEVERDGRNVLAERAAGVTLTGFVLAHPSLLARHVRFNLARLAGSTLRVLPLVPLRGGRPAPWDGGWPLLLLVAATATLGIAFLGAAWALRDPGTRAKAALLLATGALYILGLVPLLVHDRLLVALVPLSLVFLGHGLVCVARRLTTQEARIRWSIAALAGLVGALSLSGLFRASVLDYAGEPVVQREAGEWLAARYPPDTRIMSAAVAVGFYFYDAAHARNELPLPWGNAEQVLELARRQGATLLVVPQWHLRAVGHPAATVLLRPDVPFPGLRPVATLGDDSKGRIFVYEVQPAPGIPATAP